MFGTEIINNQEYIYRDGYVLGKDEWKKIEEMKIKEIENFSQWVLDLKQMH